MKLFHVSEEPGIEVFEPRPSPRPYGSITGNIVFAINDIMLHNYLLPRDCPRVCFFAGDRTVQTDIDRFIGNTENRYIINIEENWLEKVKNAKLYLYEFPPEPFELLDNNAGYNVAYKRVIPLTVIVLNDLVSEINKRNAELRVLPSLKELASEVTASSLQFSIIRLRNAVKIHH